jgi:hypothetical protein
MNVSRSAFLLAVSFLTGCSGEKDNSIETRISGRYEIVSFVSDTPLDLNNDGIKSNNLYAEISGAHHTPDNKQIPFYDFHSPGSYMEVRPLENSNNDAKLLRFNIPEQYIDEFQPGEYYLGQYLRQGVYHYYKLNGRSSDVELTNTDADAELEGIPTKLEIEIDGTLNLEMTKKFFDFVDSQWIQANVTIIYREVDFN